MSSKEITNSVNEKNNKIKKAADYATDILNKARKISVKARALALKSRGEAVVSFLKTAEQKYKDKIEAQENKMKLKGLAKQKQKFAATKSPDFVIESKVFPLPFVNSKGFRIGDYQVYVNTDLLPFSGLDQANHFLFNLFEYVNYEGRPVDEKKDIRDFFKNEKEKFKAFTPIKYPDESRTTFLEQQQLENEREYKHLRERARLLTNELAEMGKAGDPKKREEIKKKLIGELDPIDRGEGTNNEKERKKQVVLSEYLNAIDELEHGLRGDTTPLFNEALEKDNKGQVTIPGAAAVIPRAAAANHGGKKKKRKNNLRSSQKKKRRRNKTLKNRK